ncbi:MAG: hypothetical protein M1832_004355 [Thelocarpon impressellum]|nr:MAG: hypothetical protein M1832_004355 [Thelocarpon impressellum]
MSNTVHVKNISSQTSEKEVRDFFSFCGKITSLSITPAGAAADSVQSATVTFEKETAAKTALLLDNTQLGPTHVQVSGAAGLDELAGSKGAVPAAAEGEARQADELDQEDKPRSRIVAEYLAHGYVIGDQAIQRAIELDSKHGISHRFTTALTNFDGKVKATDRARTVDHNYGIMERANAGLHGLSSYFEKALGTPTGQRLVGFYTQSEKQVLDIHAEARRLADLKKADKDKMGLHAVPGTDKTACNCGGNDGTCPCEVGKCSCSGCSKATSGPGERSATGQGAEVAAASHVAPLGSNVTHEAVGGGGEVAQTTGVAPLGEKK